MFRYFWATRYSVKRYETNLGELDICNYPVIGRYTGK